ncbi:MAG: hypothetical protein AAF570_11270, partial [Bacteroidota bacterium]
MNSVYRSTWTLLLIFTVAFASSCRHNDWDDVDDTTFTDDGGWDDGGDWDGGGDGGDGGGSGDEGSLSLYDVNGNQITLAQDYSVSGDLVSFQQAKEKHNEMWKAVTTLIPQNHRTPVDQYIVFHGGGSLLGYVYPKSNDLREWVFGLDIYSAYPGGNFNSDGECVYTLIHEYAHIMSLNADQLDPNGTNCTYNPGEGCSRPDA